MSRSSPREVEPAGPRLVVGNRRSASWSLATWLALDAAGVDCELEEIDLFAPDRRAQLAAASPTGKVPVLVDHGAVIWDSLAIMEWAAEKSPALWPAHARRRAIARSVVAEAHAGFVELREQLPLDWFARHQLKEQPPARVQVELHRLHQSIAALLEDEQPFLFGPRPVLADLAMVPMAGRLRCYGLLPKDGNVRAYLDRLLDMEPLDRWFAGEPEEPQLPSPPPLVAVPRPGAVAGAQPLAAASTTAGPAPTTGEETPASLAPDSPRRLEEIVARARERERPLPAMPMPTEPPPASAAVTEPTPADAARAVAVDKGRETAPRSAAAGGTLPWLRRRTAKAPPAPQQDVSSGRRRRPPRRD